MGAKHERGGWSLMRLTLIASDLSVGASKISVACEFRTAPSVQSTQEIQQISHQRTLKMIPHYFCLIKHFCSRKPHILAPLSLLTHLGIKNVILS